MKLLFKHMFVYKAKLKESKVKLKGVMRIELYKRDLLIRQTMAEWVKSYEWQVWFTGTFRPERRIRDTITAKRSFYRYINFLSKTYEKNEIEFFVAIERFKSGYETHCHALINGVSDLTYRQLGEAWRLFYGREQVEGYKKDKGADFYLTKYVTKELCDWDFHLKKIKN